jgi:short-subunit dehydrogenase
MAILLALSRLGSPTYFALPEFSNRQLGDMRYQLKKISDQVIVLTGATSGIGLSTARMAARRGAKLVLAARNADALKQLTEEIERDGGTAVYVVADVGHEPEVKRIAEKAMERFGRIDAWVNNAGVSLFGRLQEVATEDMRRLFETNFWGMVYGSLTAVQYLQHQGGALINIGSGFSDRAAPLQGIYSASKHAVKGFTDSLRVELEKDRIPVSVSLIKPSSVNTMLTEHAKSYLDVQPRLPPPVYAPETVARAILHAAEHPTRHLYVGGGAKALAMAEHYLPKLVDRGMALLMFRLQKTCKPPYPQHRHNLHSASADMKERSPIDAYIFERSWYTEAVMHPKKSMALTLAAGLILMALWHSRRALYQND